MNLKDIDIWLQCQNSKGKKFPGITLVGCDQVPSSRQGHNGPFISWSPQIAAHQAHPLVRLPKAQAD